MSLHAHLNPRRHKRRLVRLQLKAKFKATEDIGQVETVDTSAPPEQSPVKPLPSNLPVPKKNTVRRKAG